MECTDRLDEEHLWIGRILDCLERAVANAEQSGLLDAEVCAELLHLLESFVDGQHQHKEEQVLLPAIIDKATDSDQDDLRRLLREHVEEREQMERLRARLAAAAAGQPLGVRDFATAAGEYVALHREHLQEENRVLLPLAKRTLSPDEDAQVMNGFRLLEASGPDPSSVSERGRAVCKRLDVALHERARGDQL